MSDILHDHILVEQEGYAFFVELEYKSLPLFCDQCVCIGHSIDKYWKLKGKNVEKPLTKESIRYTFKKSKHAIPINDSVKCWCKVE